MKTSHRPGGKCLKNISDKGFVCKIYKELFIFSKKKTQLKLKKKDQNGPHKWRCIDGK